MLEKRFVAPGTPAAGGSLPEPSGHGKGATIMTRSGAVTLAFLALAIPATTLAQAQVEIQLNLPGVLPPLVEIRPGVRVVRDLDEEIFFANNRYWVRRDERWYSARNPRGRWTYVEPHRAPAALGQMPPGLFRRWQGRPANLPERLPPLVTVRPGVRVVRDLDEEVFYARNYYWVRRDGHWFRARDHRRRWAYVEPRRAPPELVQSPPGHYRRWRGNEAERQGRGGEMEHGRHDQDRGQR
jgi:hypothetical protein